MKNVKYVLLGVLVIFLLIGAASAIVSARGNSTGSSTTSRTTNSSAQASPEDGGVAGSVTAKSYNSLTVLTPHNDKVTVNTGSTTKVRLMVSQTEGNLSDIVVGSNVLVMGCKNNSGTVEATEIVVESAGDRFVGKVTAVSGSTITVENPEGKLNIVTTSNTKFMLNARDVSLTDVTTDNFVTAFGSKQTDGSLNATTVLINGAPASGLDAGYVRVPSKLNGTGAPDDQLPLPIPQSDTPPVPADGV